jgi:16S rRNA (adenine1518-N6/adenine1519-N6)-dimethyltransferase
MPARGSSAADDKCILKDRGVIEALVGKAALEGTDSVLEIGGGPGNISAELLRRCGRLTIIEKDPEFCAVLKERFRNERKVRILQGDALEVALPEFDKIVANTPFSILQQFFIRLIAEGMQNFKQAVLVVPYAFARKITARVNSSYFGEMSALFMAFYDTEMFALVDKEAFNPQPRVTCACVSIRPRGKESAHAKTSMILRNIFAHDTKIVKNTIVQTLWSRGNELVGRHLVKRDARTFAARIMGSMPNTLVDKKACELTNEEFGVMTAALLKWEQSTELGRNIAACP